MKDYEVITVDTNWDDRVNLLNKTIKERELHCIAVASKILKDVLVNLKLDILKEAAKNNGIVKMTAATFIKLFKTNTLIGLTESIKRIKDHKYLAIADGVKVYCDCKIN